MPQDWKDVNITAIFKKGDRKDCGSNRGISLPFIAGKITACVPLNRISKVIPCKVSPETVWFS